MLYQRRTRSRSLLGLFSMQRTFGHTIMETSSEESGGRLDDKEDLEDTEEEEDDKIEVLARTLARTLKWERRSY